MSLTRHPTDSRLDDRLVLLILFVVALALRCFHLGANSLWVDEVASLLTAREPFWSIPEAALRQDAFEPPLYFWLLHLVATTLGESESSLRLASAVAGAATVPVLWLLTRELSGDRGVAHLSAGLLALNPLHLWYSQEARPYALMVLFGTAALLALARARRPDAGAWPWVAFSVLCALAMLSHAVGVLVPLVGWAWVLSGRDRGRMFGRLVPASIGILVLVAPGYAGLVRSALDATGTGSPERALTGLELPYTIFTFLGGYSFGPSVREIQNSGWQAAAKGHVPELAVAALVLLAAAVLVVAKRRAGVVPLLLLCLLPIAVTLAGSAATTKAYNVRYPALGIVGFVGLLGAVIAPLRGSRRVAAVAVLIGLSLWADAQWFFSPRYWKEDSRAAVAWLATHAAPRATVAVGPGYMRSVVAHYSNRLGVPLCIVSAPREGDPLGEPLPEALLLTRLNHVPHWSAVAADFEGRAGPGLERGRVTGYLLRAGYLVRKRHHVRQEELLTLRPTAVILAY